MATRQPGPTRTGLRPRPRQRQRGRLLRRRDLPARSRARWHGPAQVGPDRRAGVRPDGTDVGLRRRLRCHGARRAALRGAVDRKHGRGLGRHRLSGRRRGHDPRPTGYRHTYGAFHPDGRHFATTAGGRIMVWDEEGEPSVQRNALPGQRITELDYTSDGSRIAVSELDGTVTLLDAGTLRPMGTTRGAPRAGVLGRRSARPPYGRGAPLAGSRPQGGSWFPTAAGRSSTWSTGS